MMTAFTTPALHVAAMRSAVGIASLTAALLVIVSTPSLALSCKRPFRMVLQGGPGSAVDETITRRDAKHLLDAKGPVWRGGISKPEFAGTRAAERNAATNAPRFFTASPTVEQSLRTTVTNQTPVLIVVWPAWPELKLSDDAAEKAVQRFVSNIERQQEKSGPGLIFADTVDALLAQAKQGGKLSPEMQAFEAHKGKVLIRIADCENETYWKADQAETTFLANELTKQPEPTKQLPSSPKPAKK